MHGDPPGVMSNPSRSSERVLVALLGLALLLGAARGRAGLSAPRHQATTRAAAGPKRIFAVIATLALIVVAFLCFMAFSPWGDLPGKDFYAIAAQVIPVLLVALAIETHRDVLSDFPRWGYWLVFGALVVGEVIAFIALSGTLAAPSNTYYAVADDKWLGHPIFDERNIYRVIKDGPLVAGSFLGSLIFAIATAVALVAALIGVIFIAALRILGPQTQRAPTP